VQIRKLRTHRVLGRDVASLGDWDRIDGIDDTLLPRSKVSLELVANAMRN